MATRKKAAAAKSAAKKATTVADPVEELHIDAVNEEPSTGSEETATVTWCDRVKFSAKAKTFYIYFTYDVDSSIFDDIPVDVRKRAFFLNVKGFGDSVNAILGTTQTYTLPELLSAIEKSGF